MAVLPQDIDKSPSGYGSGGLPMSPPHSGTFSAGLLGTSATQNTFGPSDSFDQFAASSGPPRPASIGSQSPLSPSLQASFQTAVQVPAKFT